MPVAPSIFPDLTAEALARVEAAFADAKLKLTGKLNELDFSSSDALGQAHTHFNTFPQRILDAHGEEIVTLGTAERQRRETIERQRRERLEKVVEWILQRVLPSPFTEESGNPLEYAPVIHVDTFGPPCGWWEEVLVASLSIQGREYGPPWVWSLELPDTQSFYKTSTQARLQPRIDFWVSRVDADATSAPAQERRTPAEVIGGWLSQHGETKKSLAGRAGISRNTLQSIINGAPTRADSRSKVAEVVGCDHLELISRG